MLLPKIAKANVFFSKFYLKSGFWQIGINPKDRYKTTFVVPSGQFQMTIIPFGLKNAPLEFQKRMEDLFKYYSFIIVYIDNLLIFSRDISEHKKHLEQFYQVVFKHGLVLSVAPDKFIIAQTCTKYLGLVISQGKVELKPHVLTLLNFLDPLLDIKIVQIFLGCLNYIRQFYPEQVANTKILQQRLKKGNIWTKQMSTAVKNIKQKIMQLPPLSLPCSDFPFILETDASDSCWATILIQKHSKKEEVCAFASGTFSDVEKIYPSSHKEILAVKNGIKRFRLFLKSVHFTVKSDLRHMKGMLPHKILLGQGNSWVLRWALWLELYGWKVMILTLFIKPIKKIIFQI